MRGRGGGRVGLIGSGVTERRRRRSGWRGELGEGGRRGKDGWMGEWGKGETKKQSWLNRVVGSGKKDGAGLD